MHTKKQIANDIIDKIIQNLDKNIYNDYKANRETFADIVDDWIKPSLDRTLERYFDYIDNQSFKTEADLEMSQLQYQLAKWREERHLSTESQKQNLLSNVLEELTELARAKDDLEKIDAYCDIIVFCINSIDKKEYIEISEYNINSDIKQFTESVIPQINRNQIDATINDCLMSIKQLGYNPYLCMQETIKEISSRTGHYDESIGKFVKDTSDEAKAKWYKANYSKCKLAK